jgi:hypothetical protein
MLPKEDSTGTDAEPALQPDEGWARRRTRLTRICAWCRRVHMPDGTWQPGRRATDATMPTHGICPECSERADIKGP